MRKNKESPRFMSIITPHSGDSGASQMAWARAFLLRIVLKLIVQ